MTRRSVATFGALSVIDGTRLVCFFIAARSCYGNAVVGAVGKGGERNDKDKLVRVKLSNRDGRMSRKSYSRVAYIPGSKNVLHLTLHGEDEVMLPFHHTENHSQLNDHDRSRPQSAVGR